jgi:hypothetical protein
MATVFYGSYSVQPGSKVKARISGSPAVKFFPNESGARKYFESTGAQVRGALTFVPVGNGITQVFLRQ